MPIVEGKYTLASSDNFDEYMKTVGVGFATRKMAGTLTPVTEVTKTGDDEYYFKTSTTFKTSELKFKLGQEFKEETADGRTCQSTITLDGDSKLKHVQSCDPKTATNLVMYREFTGDEMKMTLEAVNPEGKLVTCTRVYKKSA